MYSMQLEHVCHFCSDAVFNDDTDGQVAIRALELPKVLYVVVRCNLQHIRIAGLGINIKQVMYCFCIL